MCIISFKICKCTHAHTIMTFNTFPYDMKQRKHVGRINCSSYFVPDGFILNFYDQYFTWLDANNPHWLTSM